MRRSAIEHTSATAQFVCPHEGCKELIGLDEHMDIFTDHIMCAIADGAGNVQVDEQGYCTNWMGLKAKSQSEISIHSHAFDLDSFDCPCCDKRLVNHFEWVDDETFIQYLVACRSEADIRFLTT